MESELFDPTLDKLIIKWEGGVHSLDLNVEIQNLKQYYVDNWFCIQVPG